MRHWLNRVRHASLLVHNKVLRLAWSDDPIRLAYWLRLHSLLAGVVREPHFLTPRVPAVPGRSLGIAELSDLLRDDLLGTWALDASTLRYLWARVRRERPQLIIECGAGVSTIMFAAVARILEELDGSELRIISIEQNPQVKAELEQRLKRATLDGYVRLIEAPMALDGAYRITPRLLAELLGNDKADWVLIDGPAGPDGCRTPALPQLLPFCTSGARWFLDDALRDGELRTLQSWSALQEIIVEGIVPVGKGIATGLVNTRARSDDQPVVDVAQWDVD
jgi:predicted O-methyltransferase YrrM